MRRGNGGIVQRRLGLSLLAALLLLTASCDDAFIDPFDNDGRFYTIYGFIDQAKNFEQGTSHAVRVIPVTRFPERIESPADAQASIDATVTSTDLRTGQTIRWRHSLEQLDDGTYGHIFRASFFVETARAYRLDVTRSDGITASAETTVPNPSGVETVLSAPQVDPQSGHITQDVLLARVPSPWEIVVIYHVGSDFGATPVPLTYGRAGQPTDDGGWRFTVDITNDLARLSRTLSIPVSDIQTPAMGLNIRLLDGHWTPPDGVFDPEVLAQPGTLSNVENGYGFWGSVGRYQHDWPVSDELRVLLGF